MEMHSEKRKVTLAVTGASGVVFAGAALRMLARDERVGEINLVASDNALRVMLEERAVASRKDLLPALIGAESTEKIRVHENRDIGATIASGSYPTSAMIVLPCSMATLAKIANGLADGLIERAADVCLKERSTLVLCVRETPFNRIHLRNMTLAAEAGATIFPLIPAFYAGRTSLEEMAEDFAARVLKFVGLPQQGAYEWRPGLG